MQRTMSTPTTASSDPATLQNGTEEGTMIETEDEMTPAPPKQTVVKQHNHLGQMLPDREVLAQTAERTI